jgi:hypothetical protein
MTNKLSIPKPKDRKVMSWEYLLELKESLLMGEKLIGDSMSDSKTKENGKKPKKCRS